MSPYYLGMPDSEIEALAQAGVLGSKLAPV